MDAGLVVRDLVLVGGGHAHVHVVRMLGMRLQPGVRCTLVSRDLETPYSGMLPGLVAGHYAASDCHVDLARLCAWAHVRFVHATCTGLSLDSSDRAVLLSGRPALRFDVLSLDTGVAPAQGVPGAAEHATAVKPIDGFASRWAQIADSASERHVAVVGGGAGGCELALALAHAGARVSLVTSGRLLGAHSESARSLLSAALARRRVSVLEHSPVASLSPGPLLCFAASPPLRADLAFWCTAGAAQPWLAASGLACDPAGCVRVSDTLESISHPNVFAAGDCASLASPRPKAGVFAVRAGPPLLRNLLRALEGRRLCGWVPQRRQLALISLGGQRCVASYGSLALGGDGLLGALLWALKDRIDRKWVAMYAALPPMRRRTHVRQPSVALLAAAGADAQAAAAAAADRRMRCGGCGAKVGATTLARVLARLDAESQAGPSRGRAPPQPEDAALVPLPSAAVLASVDFFRSFIDDPFTLGAIAAVHALGDAWAMGAVPIAALAIAQLPHAPAAIQERELHLLMAGARSALDGAGVSLAGGHSCEGAELACGFTILASPGNQVPLAKAALQAGCALVLCKPLGTGVLMAAHAEGKCGGRDLGTALQSMLLHSADAARLLRAAGARACTDVTGFGLLGHAAEMAGAAMALNAVSISIALEMDQLRLLPGAAAAARSGVASSLAPANEASACAALGLRSMAQLPPSVRSHAAFPLLTDPQTAGGLLAGVPAESAESVVAQLRAAGCWGAAVVGAVRVRAEGEPLVTLR
jgi:selenide,water dikinase